MIRPSRDEALMRTAHIWGERSTCSRLNVGCVISREGRILAQGYNGAPSKLDHCIHVDDAPCDRTVHAEASAITWAAREGVRIGGADLHVTDLPCLGCAKLVINAGIKRIVWDRPYRLRDSLLLFHEASLEVLRYDTIVS